MRTSIIIILLTTMQIILQAQNVGINSSGATPHSSAMLDVSSTSKGMLIPRMSSSQRTSISSPATGLIVFDNTTNNFWYFNGSTWVSIANASGSLVLPYTAIDSDTNSFEIINTHTTNGTAIRATSAGSAYTSHAIEGIATGILGVGVYGEQVGGFGSGVEGKTNSPNGNGVKGSAVDGVAVRAVTTGNGIAINAQSANNVAINASATNANAISAFVSGNSKKGIYSNNTGTNGSSIEGYTNVASTVSIKGIHNSSGTAIEASSVSGKGVVAQCTNSGIAIEGTAHPSGSVGIKGISNNGYGIEETSNTGHAFHGVSNTGVAIYGYSTNNAVYGHSPTGIAVSGETTTGIAVRGEATTGYGISGEATGSSGRGVNGIADGTSGIGVSGQSIAGKGVQGYGNNAGSYGVFGSSLAGTGVYATSITGKALDVNGNIKIAGGNTNPSVGAVLTSDATGNATWQKPIFFKGHYGSGTGYTLPYNSWTTVTLNEVYDVGGNNFFPTGAATNTNAFVAPESGYYEFNGYVEIRLTSSVYNITRFEYFLSINNATTTFGTESHAINNSEDFSDANIVFNDIIFLNAGDVIKLQVLQDNENVLTANIRKSTFSGKLLLKN